MLHAKDQMTCRERVEACINLQPVDRVPLYDLLRNEAVIEHYTGEKVTVQNGFELCCRAISKCLDMTRSLAGPNEPRTVVHGPGETEGFVTRVERWTSWIEHRSFDTMDAFVEWVKRSIKFRNAWKPDRNYTDAFRKEFKRRQALCGDTVILHTESGVGLDWAFHIAGWEFFSYLMADHPDLLSEWLEAVFQQEIRRVEAIADYALSPVCLTYSDIAYKDALLLSPAFLKKEWFPRLKFLNATWQKHGIKCLFHSDGDLTPIIPDLIEAGIDGLNPIEKVAGMDLPQIAKQYGNQIFFAGGIDVSQLIPFGTPEEVREECRRMIDAAGRPTGYFLGSSTELGNELPAANILAMFETAWEYGRNMKYEL